MRFTVRFHVPLLVRETANGQTALVLPWECCQLVLEEFHSSAMMGHSGVRKMMRLMKTRVWWPRMRSNVETFVKNCDVCRRTKDSTERPAGALQPLPIPRNRFESWSMDFVTDLPEHNGYNCIFTCVDRLTKMVKLIPCRMGA